MLLEELELDDVDSRKVELSATADERAEFPVVVIGCGESGLLAGIRLKEAGIPFTIIEKNAGLGGTWWENSYPGARVDVGNHFYCYSFEPSDHWTEFFAQQPELAAYFRESMNRHGIEPARPLEHRGHRRRLVGRDGPVAGPYRVTPNGNEDDAAGARDHLGGRPAQPARTPLTSRGCTTSPGRRSTPRTGTTRSTTAARGSR